MLWKLPFKMWGGFHIKYRCLSPTQTCEIRITKAVAQESAFSILYTSSLMVDQPEVGVQEELDEVTGRQLPGVHSGSDKGAQRI